MFTLPFVLPGARAPGAASTGSATDVDTGGYDVMIGGHGFRLATSNQFPYSIAPEETTSRRFDSSLEVGEQSLAPLPWVKSQSSFHAGAGQLNLEQGFTAFQYQQEQVEHIRYDNSVGIDPWTPGVVSRLPDSLFSAYVTTGLPDLVAGTDGSADFAVIAGNLKLTRVSWPSGPDAAATFTGIDLSGADFGGLSNCHVQSAATDGTNYYAVIKFVAPVGGNDGAVISGALSSASAPTVLYDIVTFTNGIVGWAKARLIGCIDNSAYELSPSAAPHTALPATPNYTHPVSSWQFSAVAESPSGILVSGQAGYKSAILELTLDTTGATPVLAGGESRTPMPAGEVIFSMLPITGSFLAVGTNKGLRVAAFDTFSGALKMGPISVDTTPAGAHSPVYGLTSRDRFAFGSFSNQHEDGATGLVRADLSMIVDQAGRMAFAPDLRAPSTASPRTGTVTGLDILPVSGRLVYLTINGVFVEGDGPGSDGESYLRTSRIRYDTSEMKLFKLGSIRGTLDTASIEVLAVTPFNGGSNLGTFGFVSDGNPGDFRLPSDAPIEWIQLEFHLNGAACQLNGYNTKAYPSPKSQDLLGLTVMCFTNEVDRTGLDVTDPEQPPQRLQNLLDLKASGIEARFTQFTPTGPTSQLVILDSLAFQSFDPPTSDSFLGGYITLKLRSTEN